MGTRKGLTSPTTPTEGCGRSRSSNAGGFEAAPATSALSAVATFTARSAVEGASAGPPSRSTGPSSVETKTSPAPGNSVTGAAKKRGTKPEVAPRTSA